MKKYKIAALALLLTISEVSFAAFACNANVNSLLVYGNGSVNIVHSGRNNYTYVCSLKNEFKGVSIPTCAVWFGILDNARDRGKQVRFYYNTTSEYSSCEELPIYGGAPAPVYIGQVN
jgi:hypothetical protein